MSPKKILEKAKELGCESVALTDTNFGYGLVDFFETAKNFSIKSILGAEIAVAKDSRFENRAGVDGREGRLVLLAKNQTGFENLLKILSTASLEGFFHQPRTDWDFLQKHADGLIVLTGATSGLLGQIFYQQGEEHAIKMFEKVRATFSPENIFLELVARAEPEQKKLNNFCVQLHEEFSTPLVVTSDARYAAPGDEEAADTLFCIGRNQQVSDPGRVHFLEKNWFKSWEEMTEELRDFSPELLETARQNSLEISNSIDLELQFGKNLLPHFSVENGETEASQLRKNCEQEISKFFPNADSEEFSKIQKRLDYELSVIGKMGFEAYFLIVQDFIQFAKKNGIAVGPGRGSAAGSLVSYLLGITTVDPLAYELLFERFLNPERISMPDIDIDFSDERRAEVLQYVVEKYGADRVSKVCTFGTLSAKAALKDVGRAQGVPFSEMNAFTKLLPNRPGFKLDDALEIPDFKKIIGAKPPLKKVFDVAKKLEGCVRHVSVHACAVIIGNEDLTRHTALQWAPGTEKVKITQFSYQQLENLGLLKMDFLGLRNLSILEKAVDHVRATTGDELDLQKIPIDDSATFEMFARGETTGVFQFESAGMRRYLKDLKPTEFEDLVAMNALYRPGPMEYIPTYIDGKNKKKKVKFLDPVLEPILKKTYGIAVYQEQVMRIAQDFSGFSLGQADILRKAIGKKKVELLAEQRKKFIAGAIELKHDEKLAVKMFDEIVVPFVGYGFNRSHAVCYARIAYETAFLRANFPVEFMAAMMTTDRNNTDRIVLEMNECAEMEIEVLPPSVNDSGSHFTVIFEKNDAAQTQISADEKPVSDKKTRFGLTAIKGLGEDTVDQIIFERQRNGKFESLQDFARRVPQKLLNKKTLTSLAFSGAFDEFGDRKAVVDSLEDLAQFAKEFQEKKSAGQLGLFGGADEVSIEFTLKNSVATKDDILFWERESLGLFVSDHPLKGLGGYFEKFGKLIGKLSPDEDLKKSRTIHGIVTNVRKILTKSGKNMAILTVEDTSGKIEIAVFPQIFEKSNSRVFQIDAFLRIRGKVEERDGNLNFIADELKLGNLKDVQATHTFDDEEIKKEPVAENFEIKIPAETKKMQVDALKKLLLEKKSDEPGASSVKIFINEQEILLPFSVVVNDELVTKISKIFD